MAKRENKATKIEVLECFECGAPASEKHYVVPRSMGGTKTVPLCKGCYAKVHSLDKYANERASELSRTVCIGQMHQSRQENICGIKEHPVNIIFWRYVVKFEEREGSLAKCRNNKFQKLTEELNTLGMKTITGEPYTVSYCRYLYAQMRTSGLIK